MLRILVSAICIFYSLAGHALTAREIMEQVTARDDGDRALEEMSMVLIDSRGRERHRTLRMYHMDEGADTLKLVEIVTPAKLRRTSVLSYDYADDDRDDDQWIYLPALRRVKRVASTQRSGNFMGSDFTYADLNTMRLTRYRFELVGEAVIDGEEVWQIEAIPTSSEEIRDTGYVRLMLWVEQRSRVVVRRIGWLEDGREKHLRVIALELIDGIWVALETRMETRTPELTAHATVITRTSVRFDQPIARAFFRPERLEGGL